MAFIIRDTLSIYFKKVPFVSVESELTSDFYLIRPSKDGEGENARREPSVQNILIWNTGTKVI